MEIMAPVMALPTSIRTEVIGLHTPDEAEAALVAASEASEGR